MPHPKLTPTSDSQLKQKQKQKIDLHNLRPCYQFAFAFLAVSLLFWRSLSALPLNIPATSTAPPTKFTLAKTLNHFFFSPPLPHKCFCFQTLPYISTSYQPSSFFFNICFFYLSDFFIFRLHLFFPASVLFLTRRISTPTHPSTDTLTRRPCFPIIFP